MINLEKYFRKHAMVGDIVTTTSLGLLPRIIYKETWGKRKRSFLRYRKRAHLGTHVAVVIKFQGRWYFAEMDKSRRQKRRNKTNFEQ